jgi:hypothetical protein
MKLALSIAAVWTAFDLFAAKTFLSFLGPATQSVWEGVAHVVAAH